MKATTPSEPIRERPVKSAAPKTTAPLIVQIYAKGMREPGRLSELQHALEARPDWRYRLDTSHDFVYVEADSISFSAEEISRVFRQIGLQARFVTNRTRRANLRPPQLREDDRHPREDSAVASETPKRGLPVIVSMPDPESLPLYVRNVATLRGLGFSFPQIARHYGVTPQAISVLLTRQRALLKHGQAIPELAGLSPRATNCLGRLRIATRAEARKHRDLQKELQAQRNCGQKTVDEILSWARSRSSELARSSPNEQTKKLRMPSAEASILSMKARRQLSAFTLIELLVVISIIALLAGLSIPAINGALKRGQSSACLSNLRQIGIATMGYAAENNMVLPPAGSGGSPEWALKISSYTGADAKRNKSIFVCPGCELPVQSGSGAEVAVTYGMHGGLMPKGGDPLALDEVKNLSSLVLCADMCQNPGNKGWSPYSIENPSEFKGGGRGGSAPSEAPITVGPDKDSGNTAWIRYRHKGSANVVMGDGSARSFKKGTILGVNAVVVK